MNGATRESSPFAGVTRFCSGSEYGSFGGWPFSELGRFGVSEYGRLGVRRCSDVSDFGHLTPKPAKPYSHSMVAGGLELTSYTTRFTPLTSLIMRVEILPSKS